MLRRRRFSSSRNPLGPSSSPEGDAIRGTRQGVLVAVEDWMLRELLRLLLEDLGYDVREATDEISTLDAIEEASEPLIVVLDLALEDMQAFDVLRTVGRDPALCFRHAYVPLLDPQESLPCDVWPLIEALGMPVLAKPPDLDLFFETVAALAAGLRGVQADADPFGL